MQLISGSPHDQFTPLCKKNQLNIITYLSLLAHFPINIKFMIYTVGYRVILQAQARAHGLWHN